MDRVGRLRRLTRNRSGVARGGWDVARGAEQVTGSGT